jgi:hypothetical protein
VWASMTAPELGFWGGCLVYPLHNSAARGAITKIPEAVRSRAAGRPCTASSSQTWFIHPGPGSVPHYAFPFILRFSVYYSFSQKKNYSFSYCFYIFVIIVLLP